MTTMQLDCFLIVAETLNFAAAAEKLNVTQPAVTQQIHALEKELNVKLFHRTTRTVSFVGCLTGNAEEISCPAPIFSGDSISPYSPAFERKLCGRDT